MSYVQFLESFKRDKFQRTGQAWMNNLWIVRPDLYHKVTASKFDPFYDDSRLGDFFTFLEKNWYA